MYVVDSFVNIILFKENRLTTRGKILALVTDRNYLLLIIIQKII